jgi:hypothetical protein
MNGIESYTLLVLTKLDDNSQARRLVEEDLRAAGFDITVADVITRSQAEWLEDDEQDEDSSPVVDHDVHACDNCGSLWYGHELKGFQNLPERIKVESVVPSGECPTCGVLCYPYGRKRGKVPWGLVRQM